PPQGPGQRGAPRGRPGAGLRAKPTRRGKAAAAPLRPYKSLAAEAKVIAGRCDMAAFGALIDPILALLLLGATPSAPPDAPRAADAAPGAVRGIVFEDLIGNGCFGGDVGNMLFDPGEPLAHDVAVLLRRPDGSIDRTLAPGGR